MFTQAVAVAVGGYRYIRECEQAEFYYEYSVGGWVDLMACNISSAGRYQHFREMCCLHLKA
jgi:hypothetical protein